MFVWLENTELAYWVAVSPWAYPMLLSLHIVGLAIVVGLYAMRDAVLLGWVKDLDLSVFLRLGTLAWAGFLLNALSGLLLFSSQASYLVTSIPFLVKICCIAVGMSVGQILQNKLVAVVVAAGPSQAELAGQRILAALSLGIWVAAIIAGRLIAYL